MAAASITKVEGTGIPVRGNDIDTDRIIPARHLRMITFEGLGQYAFEDDRISNPDHPFNNDRYKGASLLLANGNFGCGSSREHAPQALNRWGIKALVSESFGEIFQGNCTAMGIPCVTASRADVTGFQDHVEAHPTEPMTLDLTKLTLTSGDLSIRVTLPESHRKSLVEGAWDAIGMLLEGADAAKATAARLPYLSGF